MIVAGRSIPVAEIKPVTPEEAAELMSQGHVYVDVRSEPEFEAGHPEGALNVPLLNAGPVGLVPNPEFQAVMEAAFGKDEPLIIGCKAGGRSKRASELLAQAGFSKLSDQVAGFDAGERRVRSCHPRLEPHGSARRSRQARRPGLCGREAAQTALTAGCSAQASRRPGPLLGSGPR